jgi:hypothetical protein
MAMALPETTADPNGQRFMVRGKGIAWVWLERSDPKRARIPNQKVVGIWVGSEDQKEALLDLDEVGFFTEPHYAGYPAILVRLTEIELPMLERLLTDAWRLRAPRRLRESVERRTGAETG